VEIYTLGEPSTDPSLVHGTKNRHRELAAIVRAFGRVGRVVRVEESRFGGTSLVFKARRA
jgi:hypothetical protein